MTLKEILTEWARKHPEKTAVVCGKNRLSFLELEQSANRLANGLLKLGIGRGDRVAFLAPVDTIEYLICSFGVHGSGAAFIPVDVRFKIEEIDFLIKDCQPKAVISESPYFGSLASILPTWESVEHIVDLSATPSAPFLSYREILATNSPRSPDLELDAEDIAMFRYSSGTTGRPKGAMMRHRNEVAALNTSADGLMQTEDDIFLVPLVLPAHWMFYFCMYTLLRGGTVVIAPGLAADEFLGIIEREKVTFLFGFPPQLTEMANITVEQVKRFDLSSLRMCLLVGFLAADIRSKFKQRFAFDITDGYGFAESPSWVTLQPLDGTGKPGSVGKVLPGWELKIVDEDGRELPCGYTGEIAARGVPLMLGYYNRPQLTAEVIDNEGFYHSGDIGRMDEDGYLFLLGRKKEMIVVAGKEVYPVEVEAVLSRHPKVGEAAVLGIPHEVKGEVVKAVIVPKEEASAEEIESFCRLHLLEHEVPVEIEFRNFLPKTPRGTVRKEELK